jgi:HEAT repeat protein
MFIAEFQQEIRPAISGVVKLLQDSDEDVRKAAINCLSSLGAQGIYYSFLHHQTSLLSLFIAEFQQEIRVVISGVMKLLQDSDWDVCEAAINCLSSLGAQGIYYFCSTIRSPD